MINNKKIGVILQARMGSTRLPGKVLKDLIGKPMLSRIIERLKMCKTGDEIIVATSNLPQDAVVVDFANKEGVRGFIGQCDESDLLTRYLQAAQKYNIDVILRVTADCPLLDYQILDNLILQFFNRKVDYISNCFVHTYPHGVDAEVFSTESLIKSSALSDDLKEREHVVIPMRNNLKMFKSFNIEAEGKLKRPDIRITVDYPEDFQLVEEIYKALYRPEKPYFSTLEVIEFLDSHPEIKKINEKYKI